VIPLTRLNGEQFVLNAQLIRTVERTPDTVVRLTNGESVMVREQMDEIIDRVVEYERLLRGVVMQS